MVTMVLGTMTMVLVPWPWFSVPWLPWFLVLWPWFSVPSVPWPWFSVPWLPSFSVPWLPWFLVTWPWFSVPWLPWFSHTFRYHCSPVPRLPWYLYYNVTALSQSPFHYACSLIKRKHWLHCMIDFLLSFTNLLPKLSTFSTVFLIISASPWSFYFERKCWSAKYTKMTGAGMKSTFSTIIHFLKVQPLLLQTWSVNKRHHNNVDHYCQMIIWRIKHQTMETICLLL